MAGKDSSKATDSYPVPALKAGESRETEIVIKKSRFITSIGHTASTEEAKAFIAQVSAKYADARHNCFAFNATAPLSTAFCGCSDDGEPKGTAGYPMLTVLLHCGVGEITAVVTRYFGGILLGTGGLVKAYQDSVKNALDSLPTRECMIASRLSIGADHRYTAKIRYMLPEFRAEIIKESYSDIAVFEIELPVHECDRLKKALTDLTRGGVKILSER